MQLLLTAGPGIDMPCQRGDPMNDKLVSELLRNLHLRIRPAYLEQYTAWLGLGWSARRSRGPLILSLSWASRHLAWLAGPHRLLATAAQHWDGDGRWRAELAHTCARRRAVPWSDPAVRAPAVVSDRMCLERSKDDRSSR
jgi:hypothetical protein